MWNSTPAPGTTAVGSVKDAASTPMPTQFRLNATMRLLSSVRVVRVVLALAVAFWMAGAGCLLGCQSMLVAASSAGTIHAGSPTIIASGAACASMHSHDCCAKHGGKRASTSSTQPTSANSKDPQPATAAVTADLSATSGSMMDCPLAMNATAALSKAKPDQSGSELLLTRTNNFIPLLRQQVSALSPLARLPNRGHTYLRCCVFLI
jgi:hypothetical protein